MGFQEILKLFIRHNGAGLCVVLLSLTYKDDYGVYVLTFAAVSWLSG